jgi:hypothetical protein
MSKGSHGTKSFPTGSERKTIASAIVATAVIAPVWIVTGGEVIQITMKLQSTYGELRELDNSPLP